MIPFTLSSLLARKPPVAARTRVRPPDAIGSRRAAEMRAILLKLLPTPWAAVRGGGVCLFAPVRLTVL